MARLSAEARRRQILDVAATCFGEHGYRGTTTAMLAEAAGVTEPILYRHFESKQSLFVELINIISDVVLETFANRLEHVISPQRKMRLLLEEHPARQDHGEGIYRVMFQAMTEVHDAKPIARAVRRHLRRLHQMVTTEIHALQRHGTMRRDTPPEQLGWMVVHLAFGYGMIEPMKPAGHDAVEDGQIDDVLVRFLGGL